MVAQKAGYQRIRVKACIACIAGQFRTIQFFLAILNQTLDYWRFDDRWSGLANGLMGKPDSAGVLSQISALFTSWVIWKQV